MTGRWPSTMRIPYTRIKRLLDVLFALALLMLSAPVLGVACILIRLRLGTPILFIQERTGRDLRHFRLYKLRTMTEARDPQGQLRPDSQRNCQLGRFLRRFSIDELPQLINVIRGEMSLIGPRPLLPRYDPWYTEGELLRFAVRPGITGLAQVNGRNNAGWPERLTWDARYVSECSFALDLRIAVRTVARVVVSAGVAADPASQMLDLDQARAEAHR